MATIRILNAKDYKKLKFSSLIMMEKNGPYEKMKTSLSWQCSEGPFKLYQDFSKKVCSGQWEWREGG